MSNSFNRAALVVAVAGVAGAASAQVITLGEQDFNDGDFLSLSDFNNASVGEAAPFDQFYGSDPAGTVWDDDFTFGFAAGTYTAATLTIGIFDHDSGAAAGNQVADFNLDGVDLTADLNALFEGSGGAQSEYNVYTLNLSGASLAAFSDGSATFSLTLQGPSNDSLPGNGAGLDFATLRLVPAPGAVALMGLGGLAATRRRR